DGFVGGIRGEETALYVFEGILVAGGERKPSHHSEVWLTFVADLADEAEVGHRFENVGQTRHFGSRLFVKRPALGGKRLVPVVGAVEAPQTAARGDDDGVEEPGPC